MVIVGSLDFDNADVDPVGRELAPYGRRLSFEPADRIAAFDHARQAYTAFTRPRHLLVLTAAGDVHPRFADVWGRLPRWDQMDRRALARQRFQPADFAADGATATPPAASSRIVPFLKRVDVWVGGRRPGGR